MIEQSCGETWDKCREILELYTIAGGRAAEMVSDLVITRKISYLHCFTRLLGNFLKVPIFAETILTSTNSIRVVC